MFWTPVPGLSTALATFTLFRAALPCGTLAATQHSTRGARHMTDRLLLLIGIPLLTWLLTAATLGLFIVPTG